LKKISNKAKIYEYLIEGYAQSKIAKLLDVTRQRINSITKELLKERYIRCVNPKGNPKLYEATNKPYISKNESRYGRNYRPFERCRVHNVSYIFRMVVPPVEPIKWDNNGDMRNGVTQHILVYPFEDVGIVTFKRIKGKKKDTLIVWIKDSIWMNIDQLPDYEKIILSYCQQCANWFMKSFNCKLEPIRLLRKPHFAIVDTFEARVLDMCGNFSVGGSVWIDCSTGVPEWETDVLYYALIRMMLPEIVYSVMGENFNLKEENKELNKRLNK